LKIILKINSFSYRSDLIVSSLLLVMFIMSGSNGIAQFYIGPGGFVTVKQSGSLYLDTDVEIKSIAGSSGALADQNVNGAITITGDILVERYMSANEWHNVASPVSNENSGVFTGTDLVFWYNESLIWNDWNFGWVWYTGATGGPLMVFRGYDVYFGTNPVTVNYQATGAETLNTGPYTYNITLSDPAPNPAEIPSHKGWNLAGNPYPSPVDWLAASGWDKSDINDAKYIWDGANDIYTIFLGGATPVGLNGGTQYIPSNQGFWVQALHTGTLGINNAVRLGSMTATPDFYKVHPVDYPFISLVIRGNSRSDEVALRFIEGTTGGFDVNYDATKLYSFIEYVPQLSFKAGDQYLALNTLPELEDHMSFPLNFQCGENGYYSVYLSGRSHLDPSVNIYLKDKFNGNIINLSEDSSYVFHHNSSNQPERFILWINPPQDIISNINPESFFSVTARGSIISIYKNTDREISGNLTVSNMLGQIIYHGKITNSNLKEINLNVPSGYYSVTITSSYNILNYKVLIK